MDMLVHTSCESDMAEMLLDKDTVSTSVTYPTGSSSNVVLLQKGDPSMLGFCVL